MKARIYYFSGTGNSLSTAQYVAQKLGQCELVAITHALKDPSLLACNAPTIGLVTPNYYLGLPNIVVRFLSKAAFEGSPYLFLIVTSGHPFGTAIAQTQSILKHKQLSLTYARYLTMPDNYLPMFDITPEMKTATLSTAHAERETISTEIIAQKHMVTERTFYHGALMKLWHRVMARRFARMDRLFNVDTTCTSCGICEKVCPADNIRMRDSRPEWQHHCEQCYACMHFCPVNAIQYKRATRNKHRYHHPDVTWKDIAQQK
jgi:ferredoxin